MSKCPKCGSAMVKCQECDGTGRKSGSTCVRCKGKGEYCQVEAQHKNR